MVGLLWWAGLPRLGLPGRYDCYALIRRYPHYLGDFPCAAALAKKGKAADHVMSEAVERAPPPPDVLNDVEVGWIDAGNLFNKLQFGSNLIVVDCRSGAAFEAVSATINPVAVLRCFPTLALLGSMAPILVLLLTPLLLHPHMCVYLCAFYAQIHVRAAISVPLADIEGKGVSKPRWSLFGCAVC